MGCCQARDEKTSVALGQHSNGQNQDLNETDGSEFPVSGFGAGEDNDQLEKEAREAIAFSHKTIEVSDTGSKQQQFLEYQVDEGANIEDQPF